MDYLGFPMGDGENAESRVKLIDTVLSAYNQFKDFFNKSDLAQFFPRTTGSWSFIDDALVLTSAYDETRKNPDSSHIIGDAVDFSSGDRIVVLLFYMWLWINNLMRDYRVALSDHNTHIHIDSMKRDPGHGFHIESKRKNGSYFFTPFYKYQDKGKFTPLHYLYEYSQHGNKVSSAIEFKLLKDDGVEIKVVKKKSNKPWWMILVLVVGYFVFGGKR